MVLGGGVLLVFIDLAMWQAAFDALRTSAEATLGAATVQRLQEAWTTTAANARVDTVLELLTDELSNRLTGLVPTEREQALASMFWQIVRDPLMVAAPFACLQAAVALALRACLLMIFGARPQASWFDRLATVAGVMSSWILALLACGGWLLLVLFALSVIWPVSILFTVVAMLMILLLWPRFAAAPVILAHQQCGVLESLRLSYRHTQGAWWFIVTQLFWFALFAWCVRTLYTTALEAVVTIAAQHSPVASHLYAVLPLFTLVLVALKMAFIVLLWQALPGRTVVPQTTATATA